MRNDKFEIVLNGEVALVRIEHPTGKNYKIYLNDKEVGKMWSRKAGKFACKCLDSGAIFVGPFLKDATLNMIYGSFKRKVP